jgi:PPOX class probable F420-dependent enzyme
MPSNRRQQIQLSPDEQAAFFRERKKAAFATIDKDGFPHVVAMNYFARDGAFYMTSYGKAQKVVNVRRNPKVALMMETGDDYAELRGVMIRGRCEILESEDAVRAAFEGRAEAQANPAPVQPGARASAPKRVVLKIVPEKVISWDHRKLGGKY